jgi:hypothetical protein
MNGGDIIKVTKSAMLLEKSYPPGDHILRVSCKWYHEVYLPSLDTLACRTQSGQGFVKNSLPMDIPISNDGRA